MIAPRAGAFAVLHYNLDINSTELITRLRDEKSVLIVPGDQFEIGLPCPHRLRRRAGNCRKGLDVVLRAHEGARRSNVVSRNLGTEITLGPKAD